MRQSLALEVDRLKVLILLKQMPSASRGTPCVPANAQEHLVPAVEEVWHHVIGRLAIGPGNARSPAVLCIRAAYFGMLEPRAIVAGTDARPFGPHVLQWRQHSQTAPHGQFDHARAEGLEVRVDGQVAFAQVTGSLEEETAQSLGVRGTELLASHIELNHVCLVRVHGYHAPLGPYLVHPERLLSVDPLRLGHDLDALRPICSLNAEMAASPPTRLVERAHLEQVLVIAVLSEHQVVHPEGSRDATPLPLDDQRMHAHGSLGWLDAHGQVSPIEGPASRDAGLVRQRVPGVISPAQRELHA